MAELAIDGLGEVALRIVSSNLVFDEMLYNLRSAKKRPLCGKQGK